MKKPLLARYFLASVILLLVLVSVYVLSEGRRVQKELLRQTESKGLALAEAMEASAKNAILGNALLEKLVSERLLDNARLIDQLLLSGPIDQDTLKEISAMNRLSKIEVLDRQGHPWKFPARTVMPQGMREMMAQMRRMGGSTDEGHQQMMTFMWGRSWILPGDQEDTPAEKPPPVTEQKFWEGSVFGVAIGAHSIPGIIAVHANADYILNFKKEIGVQRQIQELGRQPDIHHVALLDDHFTYVAHTNPALIGKQAAEPIALDARADGKVHSRIVNTPQGRVYELIKAIRLNNSPLGYLKIGLSLKPMETAWHNSLWSILILGVAILAVGILGMAAIFYNQNMHIRQIESLEAEVARRENLSALGNLAATVAHEVRNPLNAISMGLQRLKSEFHPTADEEEYSRFIELMRGEVQRLNSIVEQFLSLARPLHLKLQAMSMAELLRELALFTGGDAQSSKVRIRVDAPDDLPSVVADRDYLKQLLLNLILNGIQAMPDGGLLTLQAATARKELVLTVADTGGGIPPETLSRIFEPYFTTKSDGSGLGLSIARRIAEAHGGSLAVESKIGQGSRFTVRLPVAGPAKRTES